MGHIIFHVSGVDAMYTRVLAAGISPECGPWDAPWGERYFHVLDPDGHELSFAPPIRQSRLLVEQAALCCRTQDGIVSGANRERRGQHEESSVEPMDLGRVRLDAERAVRVEMRPVVDLSKAEALGLSGEPEQGYALVAATCGRRRVRA